MDPSYYLDPQPIVASATTGADGARIEPRVDWEAADSYIAGLRGESAPDRGGNSTRNPSRPAGRAEVAELAGQLDRLAWEVHSFKDEVEARAAADLQSHHSILMTADATGDMSEVLRRAVESIWGRLAIIDARLSILAAPIPPEPPDDFGPIDFGGGPG